MRFEVLGQNGGAEAGNWRKMCFLSPLLPPSDVMVMRMNLPCRADFRAQLLLNGTSLGFACVSLTRRAARGQAGLPG